MIWNKARRRVRARARIKRSMRSILEKMRLLEDYYKVVNLIKMKRRKREVKKLISKYEISVGEEIKKKHIIFLVVDCWRKRNLSVYGYQRDTSPFLGSISKESAVFDAVSPSSWTYPSVASILTGLYPHSHGGIFTSNLRNESEGMLPSKVYDTAVFLPEILSHLGFKTYFSTDICYAYLPIKGKFEEAVLYKYPANTNCEFQLEKLMKWLRERGKNKTFSYVHLGDLHTRIGIPDREIRDKFGKISNIRSLKGWKYYDGKRLDTNSFKEYRENRVRLYDSIIYYVDHQLFRLYRFLEDSGLLDSCLLFVTADHGEELWEHVCEEKAYFYDPRGFYGIGHGHNLFSEVVDVPLMVIGSGIKQGRYDFRASLVDLVPTVLELLGVSCKLDLDGENLFSKKKVSRPIFSEDIAYGYEKKVIYEGAYKYLKSPGDGVELLFNIIKDQEEKDPFSLLEMEVKRKMEEKLPRFEVSERERIEVDQKIKERLRALGYLGDEIE